MIEFYPEIHRVHVTAVVASGVLFFARGLAVHLDARWPMVAPVRVLTHAIDTVLLAAALTLAVLVGEYPFVDGWLTAKVLLLVVYIVLGSVALKHGRSRAVRVACWLAALAVYGFIVSVAIARHPGGVLAMLLAGR